MSLTAKHSLLNDSENNIDQMLLFPFLSEFKPEDMKTWICFLRRKIKEIFGL